MYCMVDIYVYYINMLYTYIYMYMIYVYHIKQLRHLLRGLSALLRSRMMRELNSCQSRECRISLSFS